MKSTGEEQKEFWYNVLSFGSTRIFLEVLCMIKVFSGQTWGFKQGQKRRLRVSSGDGMNRTSGCELSWGGIDELNLWKFLRKQLIMYIPPYLV